MTNGLVGSIVVRRGPDWRWGNQDGGPGQRGKIIAPGKLDGWVRVQWADGKIYAYRMGGDNRFDLTVVEWSQVGPVASPKLHSSAVKWMTQLGHHLVTENFSRARDQVLSGTNLAMADRLKDRPPVKGSQADRDAAEILRNECDPATAKLLARVLACYHGPEIVELVSPAPIEPRGYLLEEEIGSCIMLKSKSSGLLFYPEAGCFNAVTLSGCGLFRPNLDETTIPSPSEVESFLLLRNTVIQQQLDAALSRG